MTDRLTLKENRMTTPAPRSMARLYWLALGTFATGTEGFMIAPLLPDLARDFSVSLVAAGQLVTVFAIRIDSSLRRLDVARQPAVLIALLVTMLWATGAYAIYTYLASFLSRAAGLTG